jgi:hypothetical protein
MTKTQTLKKLAAMFALTIGATGLGAAIPGSSAFAAKAPLSCAVGRTATKAPAKKAPAPKALRLAGSALSAVGISPVSVASAETAGTPCTFQLDMWDWGGNNEGTVVSDVNGFADLSVGSPEAFWSPANSETVAYARVGCQDVQGFHIQNVDLTVTSSDGTQQIVITGGNVDVPIGASYYTMLASDVTVSSQTGTDLSLDSNENGWLVVRTANPGMYNASFHMTVNPLVP